MAAQGMRWHGCAAAWRSVARRPSASTSACFRPYMMYMAAGAVSSSRAARRPGIRSTSRARR